MAMVTPSGVESEIRLVVISDWALAQEEIRNLLPIQFRANIKIYLNVCVRGVFES
jgi:hypothetical protein